MVKQKKSLGQNFLKSEKVISDIIDAANISTEDLVLEIGPGEGALTKELLTVSGKVIAIEKDSRLIENLKNKFKEELLVGKFDLIEGDALKFNFHILHSHPYKIVANIPYYITGQFIRKFLETEFQPESMTLLVQKEVAERIITHDKKESLLSLGVKAYGTPKYIRTVPRNYFFPQPNVDSAVIHISNISRENFTYIDEDTFWNILHVGFAHKRKQLLSNLSSLFPKEKLLRAFEQSEIDIKARAETIPIPKWIKLCKILESISND